MQAPAPFQDGPAFSEQELALYGQFFSQVDTADAGTVGGLQVVGLLSASGLERKVLKEIWDIADSPMRGELGPREFSVALRLVAHAQAGRPVSRELVHQEPPAPPRFAGAGPASEPQPEPRAPAPAPPQQATPPATRQRGRSPPPGEDRRLPSDRDLRKYGRLFYSRVVLNGAAMMSAAEAKDLFERSGLGNEVLQQIWFMADHDSDGQLSWPEFVLAMHLIRRTLAGQPPPQPPAGVPRDLAGLLASLEPAEAYARQPSRSPRSLSGASTPFGSASPERSGPEQAEAMGSPSSFDGGSGPGAFGGGGEAMSGPGGFGGSSALDGFGSGGEAMTGPGDFGEAPAPSGFGGGSEAPPPAPGGWGGGTNFDAGGAGRGDGGGGFGEGFGAAPGDPGGPDGLPSRCRRSRKSTEDADGFGFGGPDRLGELGAFGELPRSQPAPSFSDESAYGGDPGKREEPASNSRLGRPSRIEEHFRDERRPEEHQSPDFGDRQRGGWGLAQRLSSKGQPVEHLEVLIEAEKKLVHQLRRDTDVLDEELSRLEEACREEERAALRERSECDRIGREREILTQQLEASQRQLHELKAEHKGLHVESVLLRRDTDHYGKEAHFLQRLLDEGARDSQVLQQSIEYLEQSNQSLTAHTKALEEARTDVLAQVSAEKDLLLKEEREAILAKSALETLRAGGGAETLARLAASRQTSEAQGLSDDGPWRSRPAPGEIAAPAWSRGFPAAPEPGGGGLFSELGAPPPPPPPGKERAGGTGRASRVPAIQLREGV